MCHCQDFVFGNNDGGPWIDLGMISCQGGASTGFGAWANEGYVLEGLPGGTYFNANICSGPGAGSWDPVLTVAQYDIANSAIGNVIAYIGDCSLDFFVANSGDYILVVTELGNCNGNAPLAIENGELTVTCGSVGINDTEPNSAAITLSIEGLSPVPATDRVQVNYAAVSNTDQITLRIYNLRGQLVANQALSSVVGNNTASLDISTYSAGVYLLSLYDGTSISTAKLVKK
jgi:hypothetical protein